MWGKHHEQRTKNKGLYQNNFQISICTKQSSKNKENLPKHSLFCCVLGDFFVQYFFKRLFWYSPRPGRDTAARRKKDLSLFVQSCCLCAVNRGLENLETSCKETILFFSLVRKEPKVPEGLRPSRLPGDDSNLRSIRDCCEKNRRSSGNRRYRELQLCRVSPAMIWIGARFRLYSVRS